MYIGKTGRYILGGGRMAPVIRIDEEVMRELENRAITWRRVFVSPNQILRRLLRLDDGSDQLGSSRPASPSPTPDQPPVVQRRVTRRPLRVQGGRLLALHSELRGQGLKPHADRDGGFYEWPRRFPAILFDQAGYVIFKTEESMLTANQYLTAYPETRKVHVRDGIRSLPGYVTCPPDCGHRRLYRNTP